MNIRAPFLQERIKLKIYKVVLLTIMWLAAGLILAAIEMLNGTSLLSNNISNSMGKNVLITLVLISVLIAGVVSGLFEAFISEKRFSRLHFGKLIAYSSIYYLALYFGLFITGIVLYETIMSPQETNIEVLQRQVLGYFLTPHAWLSFMIFGVIVFFSLFSLRALEKFGPGTLSRFLAGKYFYPKVETRIFMFLDLKSSTSIAEKLGPLKYHQFLNDFYRDITYPILYKKGEIYQYVGDEISVSWSEKNGLKNNNCIECFFEIQNAAEHACGDFELKYGVIPQFKAGIHIGKTVAGEIGIIKREIVYSGDALNTTARIQELCNLYGENLIISNELLEAIQPGNNYIIKDLGMNSLRGRSAGVHLFGVENKIISGEKGSFYKIPQFKNMETVA